MCELRCKVRKNIQMASLVFHFIYSIAVHHWCVCQNHYVFKQISGATKKLFALVLNNVTEDKIKQHSGKNVFLS